MVLQTTSLPLRHPADLRLTNYTSVCYIRGVARKILTIVLILGGLVLLGFGGYKFILSRRPSAGLKVQTTPAALVFVNNNQIGQTPVS